MIAILLAAALMQAAPAPRPSTTPAAAAPAAPAAREPSTAELKAAIVKLQAQVLERDREIGQLRTRAAELELAALSRSLDALDPDVRKLLGLPDAAPAATPAPATPPNP